MFLMKYINKLALSLILLSSANSFAFGTFLNSASLLTGGEYDLSAVTNFYSGDRNGVHLMGMVDLPFTESTNLRFYGGVGSLDFSLGGNLKWIPLKLNRKLNFNLGLVGSSEYGRDGGIDAFLFRLSPFISKNFSWELGTLEPYISIPLGVLAVDSSSQLSSQFVIGTKMKLESLSYMYFAAEGGFDIKNAESYVAFKATFLLKK